MFLLRIVLYLGLLYSWRNWWKTSSKNKIQLAPWSTIWPWLWFIFNMFLRTLFSTSCKITSNLGFSFIFSILHRLLDFKLEIVQHWYPTHKCRTVRSYWSIIDRLFDIFNHRHLGTRLLANNYGITSTTFFSWMVLQLNMASDAKVIGGRVYCPLFWRFDMLIKFLYIFSDSSKKLK